MGIEVLNIILDLIAIKEDTKNETEKQNLRHH